MLEALIGLGANVTGPWGGPSTTLGRALAAMAEAGIEVLAVSALITTAPVSPLPQPDYVNAVARVRTSRGPAALMRALRAIERAAGRRRGPRSGPRTLDLDLLDCGGRILGWTRRGTGRRPSHRIRPLVLPHPELHRRAFVLCPLSALAPNWVHPVHRRTARQLAAALPATAVRGVGSLAGGCPAHLTRHSRSGAL